MRNRRAAFQSTMVLTLVSVLGFLALRFATASGIGLTPDSIHYLDCARHIARGQGYGTPLYNYQHPIPIADYILETQSSEGLRVQPQTQFPPMFSLVLAGFASSSDGGEKAIRFLIPLLFSLNIVLAGSLAARMTGGNPWFVILAGILVFAAIGMLDVHTAILSEPLFLAFGLASLLALSVFIDGRRPWAFIIAILACAAALFTRFAGVSFVVAGTGGLFFLGPKPRKKRLPEAIVFGALASLPCFLFLLRNLHLTGHLANRPVGWTPTGWSLFSNFLPTLSGWILPIADRLRWPTGLKAILGIITIISFVGLALFVFLEGRRNRFVPSHRISRDVTFSLAGLYLVSYLVMSIFLAFFDKEMDFERRILSPAQAIFIIVVIGAIFRGQRTFLWTRRWGVYLLFGIAIAHSAAAGMWVVVIRERGRGYNATAWHTPAVKDAIEWVRHTPPDVPIFSNDPAALNFLSQRYAYLVPSALSPSSLELVRKALIYPGPMIFVVFKETARTDGKGAPIDGQEIEDFYRTRFPLSVVCNDSAVVVFRRD